MCKRVLLVLLTLYLLPGNFGQDILDQHETGDVTNAERSDLGLAQEDEALHLNNQRSRLEALQAELEDHLNQDGEGAIPGEPELDYPVFSKVPQTSFSCADKHAPGYYADIEARCQAFHICDTGGAKHSFLCPGGSVFNQKYLVCDWWYGFICEDAPHLFEDQRELYRLIQKESNQNKQRHNDLSFQTNEDFVSDAGQNNYIFPNEFFHGAETGVPNRERQENLKGDFTGNNRETKTVEKDGKLNNAQESLTNHKPNLSALNKSSISDPSSRKELSSAESETFKFENRRAVKSVVRKKQHNDRFDQRDYGFRDSVDSSSTEGTSYRDEKQTPLSFENVQNVYQQTT